MKLPFKVRYNALGMAYKALTPTEQDAKDQTKASPEDTGIDLIAMSLNWVRLCFAL